MQIKNPVVPGFYPDPSVCRVGEDYYLVTSTFEYFPGVPVFHSRDLAHWRQIGHCLTRTSQLPLEKIGSSCGIYAPTIRHHNGTFYMVTTNVAGWPGDLFGQHFYVTADDPAGEWSEPVPVERGDLPFSIDPSLCFDDDGTVYFTCNGPGGIYQFVIDIVTGKRLTDVRRIWGGAGWKSPEGAHLYQIGGMYYLLVAEGGTEYGHCETIARSAGPWGPFEPYADNPILTHRSIEHPIQCTGHAELVQAHEGSWWLVFLGVRPNGYPPCYHLGRETFLAPVRWTEEGWPVVGRNGVVDLDMEVDGLPAHPWDELPTRDEFDRPDLDLRWNFLRNPRDNDWSLTARPGWLRLNGSAVSLNEADSPAFLGRRQRYFNCYAATLLEFEPAAEGEEAGLTALMNERHHYEIAVTRRQGERRVIVHRRIGSLAAVVAQKPLGPGPVILRIDADRDLYRFSYARAGQERQALATGETRYLSTEVAGGFTGVYLGPYATGLGRPSATPADFDWFEHVPTGAE
jgi:xylan 1,4-beta-xylosidase